MPRLTGIYERAKVPENKGEVYDYIIETRGRMLDMYAALLHSPEIAGRIAHVGSFFKFESILPKKTLALLASTISAELDNKYEQNVHGQMALKQGASQLTIDAVSKKTDLTGLPEDEALPVRCARELGRDHQLSDASFAAAQKAFGDKGVVEMISAISFFGMLAFAQNALQAHAPHN